MSNAVPPLLTALIDDAAVFPPGSAALADAVPAHDHHRRSWYAPLIGPLLLPVASLADPLVRAVETGVGVVGEPVAIERAFAQPSAGPPIRQIESPVAKRGEDPSPGIKKLAALMRHHEEPPDWYFEVPLAWGLMSALDQLAELRAEGLRVAAKFRTGGLAAELFPTPVELAAVICACRDRGLPFKLTAGLHHAVRHTDAETGLVHHGFVNVLVAVLAAADGAEPADLSGILATTDALPLAEAARGALGRERPLWVGFGSCSVTDPVADLTVLGLLSRPKESGTAGTAGTGSSGGSGGTGSSGGAGGTGQTAVGRPVDAARKGQRPREAHGDAQGSQPRAVYEPQEPQGPDRPHGAAEPGRSREPHSAHEPQHGGREADGPQAREAHRGEAS